MPLDLAAVAAHLARDGLSLDLAAGAALLSGGLSNFNYRVVVDGRPCVLRRPPDGVLPPGAHDMAREHRVLSRLGEAFPPAPRSFHLCRDRTVIGVDFQLIEWREGLVVRGDRLPPELDDPADRRRLSDELVTTLAALHAVDAAAVGLGDLGRPEGFWRRTAEGWLRRGSGVGASDGVADALRRLAARLLDCEPPPSAPALLHSDFKLDNCMLTPDLRVGTVVDWDMGTRGDPLWDLATLASYWTEPGDPDCMHRLAQMPTAAPGFATRDAAVELYARRSGRDVAAFPAWRALALVKLGVVFLQLHRLWLNGATQDPRYAGFATLGAAILDHAVDVVDAVR